MPKFKLPVQPGCDPVCVGRVVRVPESMSLQHQVASQELVRLKQCTLHLLHSLLLTTGHNIFLIL